MPTLILSARYTEDARRLWLAAIQQGWDVERIIGWRIPTSLQAAVEPVLYMEALSAPIVAEALDLELLEPAVDWLPCLPDCYRLRSIRLTTLGDARISKGPSFLKPPNDKSFPARCYAQNELPEGFSEDMPILVSEVVSFTVEFRCFVLDRVVRTLSLYSRNGELVEESDFVSTEEEREGLGEFVETLLADDAVELPRAVVLDVGIIQGRGWAIVEANAAWGAGIYGCEPVAVLDVVRNAVTRRPRKNASSNENRSV